MDRAKLHLFSMLARDKISWDTHVAFFGKVTDFKQLDQSNWHSSKNLALWLLSNCHDEAIRIGNLGAETPFYMAMSRMHLLSTYLTLKEQNQLVMYLTEKDFKIAG